MTRTLMTERRGAHSGGSPRTLQTESEDMPNPSLHPHRIPMPLCIIGKTLRGSRVDIERSVVTLLLAAAAFTGSAAAGGNTTGLFIPRDSSFSVVPFTFEDPAPAPPLYRNDDGSSDSIHLLFSFQFFGAHYSSVYINNNGNISLERPSSAFTPAGFPESGFRMIAAFWADVDTRDPHSGVVCYKSEAHRFVVIWDSVGYSSYRSDRRNTFEIILTDETDPAIGIGNNVAFSYADMQWTTGSLSGGSGGFGGTPAMVGINRGDGVTSTVIGRFDHEGTDPGNPGGPPGGVSWLDDRLFAFGISAGWTIYPGDANADGIVDARDILPLGQYFGKTGPPRPGGSLVWGPQDLLQPWTPPDACHADCNGDGTINANDIAGIIQNWFRSRTATGSPQVNTIVLCEALLEEIDRQADLQNGMLEIRRAILDYLRNRLGVVYGFALMQNWPNPFNPSTTFSFSVPDGVQTATVSVYTLLGQCIWEKRFSGLLAGTHEVVWSGETSGGAHAASGVYVYRLVAGDFTSARHMMLLK